MKARGRDDPREFWDRCRVSSRGGGGGGGVQTFPLKIYGRISPPPPLIFTNTVQSTSYEKYLILKSGTAESVSLGEISIVEMIKDYVIVTIVYLNTF